MEKLRKLISILLLAFFGLPFVSPLLASTAKSEANLPACCRRDGKHHCMMRVAERSESSSRRAEFHAPFEKCPYCPAFVLTSHHSQTGMISSSAAFAELLSHPSVHPQTESRWRVSRDRSRNKRGPPYLSLL